ncbi:MAG: epimerase [Proteobacteria bacterium]|nr:MAG: epimerase [Pseudomonadota bacterium]
METLPYRSVLVTGGGGYIGRLLVESLARAPGALEKIVATDVRLPDAPARLLGVTYEHADVRSSDLADAFRRHGTDVCVHLAAIVTPGRGDTRALEYEVDVVGSRRVLEACVAAGVRKLIYTSSGAAYGYHADNPEWLGEHDALRGNREFAYSDHKRQVEELLARYRSEHPELLQLVFRPGTILGARAQNQITALFDGRFVLGLRGSDSPFVFVWDEDVVGAIAKGIRDGGAGVFNLAGDGKLSMREIARILGKRYVALPPGLVAAALAVAKPLGLSRYGPEQVRFLMYRPVLSNRRLVAEFGYAPRKTSREVFDFFLEARRTAR